MANRQRHKSEILNPYSSSSRATFDFWLPVYRDQNGKLFSPGCTDDRGDNANAWDYVYLGLIKTPGVATVQITKERAVDKKKSAGKHGATLTIHGVNPAEGNIQLVIWTPEQLNGLNILWPQLFDATPKAGKEPHVYDVVHPAFKLHGVKSVLITGGSGPDSGPVPQSRTFTIKWVEYIPKPKGKAATKTPVEAIATLNDPGAGPAQVTTPFLPGAAPSQTGPYR